MLKPVSVSEITFRIKNSLEQEFKTVLVEGEISNLTKHSSGHIYFTLKDDKSQLRCTLWKWQRKKVIKFAPENGMMVVVGGEIRVYEKGGSYQLNIQAIEPKGKGALQVAFEQLKEKLSKEGLFDGIHKKDIPLYPRAIGVVTSETGAAFRDIVNVLTRRAPSVKIIINSALVQGEEAGRDIARAIKEFNEYNKVDLLIVGRGGGSLEDLWAFNEEIVARAVFDSKIPVISAVGHEIDFTICDFVSDKRAPTPSAAAEIAVVSRDELVMRVKNFSDRIAYALKNSIESYRSKLKNLAENAVLKYPYKMIEPKSQRLDELNKYLQTAFNNFLNNSRNRLKNAAEKLEILSPLSSLSRGYSITSKNGEIINSVKLIEKGDIIETRLHDGVLKSSVI